MLKFIRYALATLCFAASVACLALWWRSMSTRFILQYTNQADSTWVEARLGYIIARQLSDGWTPADLDANKYYQSAPITTDAEEGLQSAIDAYGGFGRYGRITHFPLWYPALAFALAGIGILRIGRFTTRSALMVTTIVALLLGMVVIL